MPYLRNLTAEQAPSQLPSAEVTAALRAPSRIALSKVETTASPFPSPEKLGCGWQ
jgi:hypothetical protein